MRWTDRVKRTLTGDEIHARLTVTGTASRWLQSLRDMNDVDAGELEEPWQDRARSAFETPVGIDSELHTDGIPQETSDDDWTAENTAYIEELFPGHGAQIASKASFSATNMSIHTTERGAAPGGDYS